MARLDRFLVTDDWDELFDGAIQKILPKLNSDHSPVLLEGGGLILRGPLPFRFENMLLKTDRFIELIYDCWQSYDFRGLSSYIMMEKLKSLKIKLKSWNKEVFGRVEVRKRVALEKLALWDNLESQRPLSLNEMEEKVAATNDFKKWALLEETS